MTDKILKAVKALGGDLGNRDGSYQTLDCRKVLWINDRRICTKDEFNTYAAEWLKEAYMHNAAIDLGWDVNARDCNRYIVNVRGDFRMMIDTLGYVDICTEQEFIDYCEANKPIALAVAECAGNVVGKEYADALASINNSSSNTAREILPPQPEPYPDFVRSEESPVFTQAMADAGELPPVGCVCELAEDTKSQYGSVNFDTFAGDVVEVIAHKKGGNGHDVVVAWHEMECVAITLANIYDGRSQFKPIKPPRDKAIESMLGEWPVGCKSSYEVAYDWLKQLTPEQRKEFDL